MNIELKGTLATDADKARVMQCAACGTIVCHPVSTRYPKLHNCPHCLADAWDRMTPPLSVIKAVD